MAETLENSEFTSSSNEQMTRQRREQTRLRQIQIGKARPEYRRYLEAVPVEERTPSQPRTPDHRTDASKRQFDRLLSTWRRSLHGWDESSGNMGNPTLEGDAEEDDGRDAPESRVVVSLETAAAAADAPAAAPSRTPVPAGRAARRLGPPEDAAPARRISLADHVPHHSPAVPAFPSPQQPNPWYENFSPMRFPTGTPMTPAPRQPFNPYLGPMAETPETHKLPQTSVRAALNPLFSAAQTPQDKFAMAYNQAYSMVMMASPMMQGVSADTTPQRPSPQSLSIHMMQQMRQQEQMKLQMQHFHSAAAQATPVPVPAPAQTMQQQPQAQAQQPQQLSQMLQGLQQAMQQQQLQRQQQQQQEQQQPPQAPAPAAAAPPPALPAAATTTSDAAAAPAAAPAPTPPALPLCESPVARRTLQQLEATSPRMWHSPTDAPCTPKRMTARARSWSPPYRHGSGESAAGANRDNEIGRRGGCTHRDSPPPSVVKTPNPRCLVAETPSPTYHHYGQLSIGGMAPALPGVCRAMPFMPGEL
eukprot:CAMPEP_0206475040 /NCGR_PEP_ID=MMETSP0324_2-20121206/33842_1 /ASSEMBLY_ACC=CAM_ASM_000836 /TAXON_ID=2866 /ORGANISM="Crypthecodinium cohnii, Strain Seligo" /LENGTH=530 /DNA_ID=CAMNT_0053950321 /DNA_START=64 /DNA_END=1656 /DNA_ORIENTATION=+